MFLLSSDVTILLSQERLLKCKIVNSVT